MAPKGMVDGTLSDASTLIYDNPADVAQLLMDNPPDNDTLPDVTLDDIELPGEIVSDEGSLSSLGSDDDEYDEMRPMRDDMDIVTTRWQPHEVDALMTALNVNRDAVKYHFEGTGGGREVKRQAWVDVASK